MENKKTIFEFILKKNKLESVAIKPKSKSFSDYVNEKENKEKTDQDKAKEVKSLARDVTGNILMDMLLAIPNMLLAVGGVVLALVNYVWDKITGFLGGDDDETDETDGGGDIGGTDTGEDLVIPTLEETVGSIDIGDFSLDENDINTGDSESTNLDSNIVMNMEFVDNSKDVIENLQKINEIDTTEPMKKFASRFEEISGEEKNIIKNNIIDPYNELLPILDNIKTKKNEADRILASIKEVKNKLKNFKSDNGGSSSNDDKNDDNDKDNYIPFEGQSNQYIFGGITESASETNAE